MVTKKVLKDYNEFPRLGPTDQHAMMGASAAVFAYVDKRYIRASNGWIGGTRAIYLKQLTGDLLKSEYKLDQFVRMLCTSLQDGNKSPRVSKVSKRFREKCYTGMYRLTEEDDDAFPFRLTVK